jgi:hypothetical protein
MKERKIKITPHEPEEELAGLKDAMKDVEVMKNIIKKKLKQKNRAYTHLQQQGMIILK